VPGFFKRLVEFQTLVLGAAAPGKRNFLGISQLSHGISVWDRRPGSASARRLQSGDHPTADRGGEPVDCRLVENKPDWRLRQLFAITHENAALPEQPHCSDGQGALIGIG
jgi:hypothetical protein